MRPDGFDRAFIEDDNPIRLRNGAEMMRDDNKGLAAPLIGLIAALASSSTTIGLFLRIARAMAIRCRSPPDSALPSFPVRVS